MKHGLLRLISGTGELRLRAGAAMTAVITILFPTTLPPADRALVLGNDGQIKYAGVGATAFRQGFAAAGLTAGKITITHNLNNLACTWALFDNAGDAVLPDNVRATANTMEIDVSSLAPITGTWQVVIIG
jgi:hypothetical protein